MASQDKKLLNFVSAVAGEDHLKVEEDLGQGYSRLKVAEAERRQAKHDIRGVEDAVIELLRNSRDAGASKIFLSSSKEEKQFRKIILIDDGEGIPSEYHHKIFESRVTSRLEKVIFDQYGLHGRGLALFSLKSSVDSASVVAALPGKGSVFKIVIDTQKLPERTDQSSFPLLRREANKLTIKSGVSNVPRIITEFNLAYPHLEIYFGSPTEILTTMRHLSLLLLGDDFRSNSAEFEARGPKIATDKDMLSDLFLKRNLKLWQGPLFVSEANKLQKMAKTHYGLEISLRNAHRVIKGEVEPVARLMSIIGGKEGATRVRIKRGKNLAQLITEEDLKHIGARLRKDAERIAQKYFLRISKPRVLRVKNQLKMILELEKDEQV